MLRLGVVLTAAVMSAVVGRGAFVPRRALTPLALRRLCSLGVRLLAVMRRRRGVVLGTSVSGRNGHGLRTMVMLTLR